ncbi:MAG TPA: DUF1254 domain-containing protein [Polyangiales bacterium]|nr:DUF1254 domain-containing protein [Polyangiales bacterium]
MQSSAPHTGYFARAFTPVHENLANSGGVPARLANERYVESLARIVYYWGYPAVDCFGRTEMWEQMKSAGPGTLLGLFPAAPKNTMAYLDDYMPPAQRKVVSPNADTIYGVGFVDLTYEGVVLQTPAEVPDGHYWVIQIVDIFTTVTHTLGSARKTPGGKFLLVGPRWKGPKPAGFVDVLRSPTHVAGVFGRSFTARTPETKARARAVLNQIGLWPQSQDTPSRRTFDCEAVARNKVFPPGITADMVANDPDMLRNRPVNPRTFWNVLQKALDANPDVAEDDAPMAVQARTLLALRDADPAWRSLIDRAAFEADAELHDAAKYHQTGVEAGNGWQRQENGGLWGTDWFGRAQAAVIYIFVNDYHEAVYFARGTDARGGLLEGRYRYSMRFEKGALPPVDRTRGGFWSVTMYDHDYFMLPSSPNGRNNIGTVNLDANELKFAPDGSLTLHFSRQAPDSEAERANWLPAPDGPFALLVRTYVVTEPIQNGTYKLPDVVRVR